ncbi:MAG: tetratricopeptide repeat protein [Treponema sp.]|jgi:tetratricopeptide (TPR) repeat protein|nr:tetratricopeptide repeat protein [Treponema sp.]
MAGNQPNRSGVIKNGAPGEKPVINEQFESYVPNKVWKWDFPDTSGKSTRRQGKEAEPVKAQKAAKKTGEDVSSENRLKKGMRLYRIKRWENALEEFLLVETEGFNNEERAELAYHLGLCYTKLERFDEALLYFEQVLTISNSPLWTYQCRLIIAYIYIITGRATLAENELKNLEAGGLESAMLYNTLAYAEYIQKNYLAAIEWYEKALDIEKDNPTALNSMGYILADTGMDTQKGLRLCRKAVEKNPQNAAYLDSLGWASYRCGKLTEARNWLRRALEIAPQQKEIKEHFRFVSEEAV